MSVFDCRLLKGNVLMAIEQPFWNGLAKADMKSVETDANKRWLGVTKQLFDRTAKSYVALRNEKSRIKKIVLRWSSKSYFKDGIFLVKQSAVSDLEGFFRDHLVNLKALAKEFAADCPRLFQEAQAELRSQFRWVDYPGIYTTWSNAPLPEGQQNMEDPRQDTIIYRFNPQAMIDRFGFEFYILQISVPEGLEPEIREREEAKLRERFNECEKQVAAALYEGFNKILENVVDRLKPGEDGKRKRFTGDLFNAFLDFVENIKNRNVLDDARIEELCAQGQSILDEIAGRGDTQSKNAAERLRDYSFLRDETAKSFEKIKNAVTEEIAKMPARRFEFEEETAEA